MTHRIELVVNGRVRAAEVDVRDSLLDLLRDRLGLTGTKRGCDQGECGACTVLLDGGAVNACTVLALEASGRAMLTIEGLAAPELDALQRAFVACGAVQCGFCTPGMILSAKAYLDGLPARGAPPSDAAIRRALSGNLCRCTGYRKIVEAVGRAWGSRRHGEAAGG
ncbi:MAG: (2Fe-2S)-binding protein [Gemmatimonadota bacterium]